MCFAVAWQHGKLNANTMCVLNTQHDNFLKKSPGMSTGHVLILFHQSEPGLVLTMSGDSVSSEPVQQRTFKELALFFHGLENHVITFFYTVCLCMSPVSIASMASTMATSVQHQFFQLYHYYS